MSAARQGCCVGQGRTGPITSLRLSLDRPPSERRWTPWSTKSDGGGPSSRFAGEISRRCFESEEQPEGAMHCWTHTQALQSRLQQEGPKAQGPSPRAVAFATTHIVDTRTTNYSNKVLIKHGLCFGLVLGGKPQTRCQGCAACVIALSGRFGEGVLPKVPRN